jgi:hypothetical protein
MVAKIAGIGKQSRFRAVLRFSAYSQAPKARLQ